MLTAQYCGLSWEADFWRVLNAAVLVQYKPLDIKFDIVCGNKAYARYQRERLRLHETKCYESNAARDDAMAMVIYCKKCEIG